jgi:hypothetical protein
MQSEAKSAYEYLETSKFTKSSHLRFLVRFELLVIKFYHIVTLEAGKVELPPEARIAVR